MRFAGWCNEVTQLQDSQAYAMVLLCVYLNTCHFTILYGTNTVK